MSALEDFDQALDEIEKEVLNPTSFDYVINNLLIEYFGKDSFGFNWFMDTIRDLEKEAIRCCGEVPTPSTR